MTDLINVCIECFEKETINIHEKENRWHGK
jgi:hypothetical protein